MLNPSLQTRTARIATTATAAQTLPFQAVAIVGAYFLNGNAVAGSPPVGAGLTPVTVAPGATTIQFTGTPSAPSATVTLSAAAVAGELLIIEYVPVGAIPAAA
jgi:hypothetical protein